MMLGIVFSAFVAGVISLALGVYFELPCIMLVCTASLGGSFGALMFLVILATIDKVVLSHFRPRN